MSDPVGAVLSELSKLSFLCSKKTVQAFDAQELITFKDQYRKTFKTSNALQRESVGRFAKTFLTILRDYSRAQKKEISNIDKHVKYILAPKPKTSTIIGEDGATSEGKAEPDSAACNGELLAELHAKRIAIEQTVQGLLGLCGWFAQEILDCLYPGATSDRELLGIDLYRIAIDVLSKSPEHLRPFHSADMVRVMLNLLLSPWDKHRRIAADLLVRFPRPLAGYECSTSVGNLLQWGLALSGSARQRESEAGALVLRKVFLVYSVSLGWTFPDMRGVTLPLQHDAAAGDGSAALLFVEGLCRLFEARLDAFKKFIAPHVPSVGSTGTGIDYADKESHSSLCHGLLLSIKRCLQEVHAAAPLGAEWQLLFRRVLSLASGALLTGMAIVGNPEDDVSEPSMAATYVNSNSSMVYGSAESELDGDAAVRGKGAQAATVESWLLVKESCGVLAALVQMSPIYSGDGSGSGGGSSSDIDHAKKRSKVSVDTPESSAVLLSPDEITSIASLLVNSLARLKHLGAIAEAAEALQQVALCLLRARTEGGLSDLPGRWMNSLLDRLENERQVYILRRSESFALTFLSILSADAINRGRGPAQSSLLSLSMETLIELTAAGLRADANLVFDERTRRVVGSAGSASSRKSSWRICVHAMNVIRLILSSSSLRPAEVDVFIPAAVALCVKGFAADKWGIRNSSMLVFSSVIRKVIDGDGSGRAKEKAPTPYDFFDLYPVLFPFLLGELADITGFEVSCDADGDPIGVVSLAGRGASHSTTSKGASHPSLYPTLMLLSKLRCPLTPHPSKKHSLSLFEPLIASCRGEKAQYIREIAANAMAAIVPLSTVALKLTEHFEQALAEVDTQAPTNRIHGSLLLILAVLRNFNAGPVGIAANISIVAERPVTTLAASAVAMHKAWTVDVEAIVASQTRALASPTPTSCPPLHWLLIQLESSAPSSEGAVSESLSRIMFPQVYGGGAGGDARRYALLPFGPVVVRAVARRCITSAADCASETAARLQHLLHSDVCEAREGAVDGLRELFATSPSRAAAAKSPLRDTLLADATVLLQLTALVAREQKQELRSLALGALCECARANPSPPIDVIDPMWTAMIDLCLHSPTPSLAATAEGLEVLGWLAGYKLRRAVDLGFAGVVEGLLVEVGQWAGLVVSGANSAQPATTRGGAADSLIASGAVPALDHVAQRAICDASAGVDSLGGGICLLHMRLLGAASALALDDDEAIRRRMGSSIQASGLPLEDCLSRALAWALADADGRAVSLFLELLQAAGGDAGYVEQMCSFTSFELSQRAFEMEDANLNVEPALVASSLASCLHAALRRVSEMGRHRESSRQLVDSLCSSVCQSFIGALSLLSSAAKSVNWIGGCTYHRDIFCFVRAACEAQRAVTPFAPHVALRSAAECASRFREERKIFPDRNRQLHSQISDAIDRVVVECSHLL